MEPALEMWIEGAGEAIVLKMAGSLDGRTGSSILRTVTDLLAEGCRHILADVWGLELQPTDDLSILDAVESEVERAGGLITWIGLPLRAMTLARWRGIHRQSG